jgi:hypothetical protein
MTTPRAALQAAGQRASAAHRDAWIAGKLIAVEEAESTLEPLRAAISQIYSAKRAVDSARESILRELRYDDGDTAPVFSALADFDSRRKAAESIPLEHVTAPDGLVPDGQHELAVALARLGPVGPTWDVGAPKQSDAQRGGFFR